MNRNAIEGSLPRGALLGASLDALRQKRTTIFDARQRVAVTVSF